MNELLLACVGIGAGLVFLIAGGDLLVRGASAVAVSFRISPLLPRWIG